MKGEIAEGKWFEKPSEEERTFKEMMEKYAEEHSKPNKASAERDKASLLHLSPFFEKYRLAEITPSLISECKARRRAEGAAPGTVNREMALVKHGFNFSCKVWEGMPIISWKALEEGSKITKLLGKSGRKKLAQS